MFPQNTASFLFSTLAAAYPFTPHFELLRDGNINDAGAGIDQYILHLGDGSTAAGWPSMTQWVDFDSMFNSNKAHMLSSCMQWKVPNNSQDEVDMIHSTIQQLSQSTGVDNRVILAIVIQESDGCVRVPTTNNGVRNPGLMQSHNGSGTCHSDITQKVQDPCPQTEVTQMITDGVSGTASGDGLATIFHRISEDDAQSYYRTARAYNSGSIDSSGKLEKGISTHCYASDIANRLSGWVNATHKCFLDQ